MNDRLGERKSLRVRLAHRVKVEARERETCIFRIINQRRMYACTIYVRS